MGSVSGARGRRNSASARSNVTGTRETKEDVSTERRGKQKRTNDVIKSRTRLLTGGNRKARRDRTRDAGALQDFFDGAHVRPVHCARGPNSFPAGAFEEIAAATRRVSAVDAQ